MISYLHNGLRQHRVTKGSLLEVVNDYTIVMNEKGKQHHWNGVGPLSLKIVLKGDSVYQVGNKRLTLDEGRLLVLNEGQAYTVSINSDSEVETFIVFFDRILVNDVLTDFCSTSSSLVDNPNLNSKHGFMFSANTLETSKEIQHRISSIKASITHQGIQATREQLYFLLSSLTALELGQQSKAHSLGFNKKSTRDEIARRLLNARDYLHSSLSQPITLVDLSEVSALSKNHLLRTFKAYFGKTPFQYLSAIRIDKAKRLLANNPEASVTDVCSEIGFESLSTFSWTFSKQVGITPSEFKLKKVIGKK